MRICGWFDAEIFEARNRSAPSFGHIMDVAEDVLHITSAALFHGGRKIVTHAGCEHVPKPVLCDFAEKLGVISGLMQYFTAKS